VTLPADQPVKPVRTWRPMAAWSGAILLALAGCHGQHDLFPIADFAPEMVEKRCGIYFGNVPREVMETHHAILAEKDPAKQIRMCKDLIAKWPNFEHAHAVLGLRYYEAGQYEDALAELDWCITNGRDKSGMLECLGTRIEVLNAVGRKDEARRTVAFAKKVVVLWGRDDVEIDEAGLRPKKTSGKTNTGVVPRPPGANEEAGK
jgi:hypothetical protein